MGGENELTLNCEAELQDPTTDYSGTYIPFRATLPALEDGAVYYFVVSSRYGSSAPISTEIKHFFTLPKGPVDLDLPSGNLWASHNLGADYPYEPGDYFAWGETEPKKTNSQYDWSSYKWCMGAYNRLTKYCSKENYSYNGFVDTLVDLDSSDDAANLSLGESWYIPYPGDFTEMINNCQWTSWTYNGVTGWIIRSKSHPDNDKKVIFIPVTGYYYANQLSSSSNGYYWTSRVDEGTYSRAVNFGLSSRSYSISSYRSGSDRCRGLAIRPVCRNDK